MKEGTYYQKNREAVLAKQREYREANREAILAKQKAYRAANREVLLAKQKAYREANPDRFEGYKVKYRERQAVLSRDRYREAVGWKPKEPTASKDTYYMRHREERKAYAAKYREANRPLVRASHARSKACRAHPAWANWDAIVKVYAGCPDGLVVDHYVPLNAPNVSGLHVAENLQYLTPSENLIKRSHWDPDAPLKSVLI